MSMVVGIGPGNDSAFSEQKVKGYKNFSNKLWNITRFVLSSTEGQKCNVNFKAWSEKDAVLNSKLKDFFAEITKEMDDYKLYLVSEKLYAYVWHEFADVILEESKNILANGTPAEKESREQFLLNTLEKIIRALHPFMPFVTEEIWSHLPLADKKLLIIETWPM
jgi:valyl-tRNA synthetase